jgi:hypothetical protein
VNANHFGFLADAKPAKWLAKPTKWLASQNALKQAILRGCTGKPLLQAKK